MLLLQNLYFARIILVLFLLVPFVGALFHTDLAYALFSPLQNGRGKFLSSSSSRGPGEYVKKLSTQELQGNEMWKSFLLAHGNDWQILWDTGTNSLLRAVNKNVSSGKAWPGTTDQASLIKASQRFLQDNEPILKVPYQDFQLEKVYRKGNIWYLRFKQYSQGIPVYGGSLLFRYDQAGKLLMFGGNIYPGIAINPADLLGEADALRIAAEDIGYPPDSLVRQMMQLVVYPRMSEDGQSYSYFLCWEIDLVSEQPARGWKYLIDANDGTIREGYDRARYAVSGTIKGQILPKYFDDYPVITSFPNLKIVLLNKQSPLLYKDLQENPGWSGTALYGWEYGVPSPGSYDAGGSDPDKAHTGNTVYGYNLYGNYNNNMGSPAYLTTHLIDCREGENSILRFWRWLGVEGSDEDKATLDICNNLSNNWTNIWTNPKEPIYDGDWKLVSYDLSSLADGKETFFIRWGMGPTDGTYSSCGWNIDDIGLYSSIGGVTDKNGNFLFTGEAQTNILDVHLKGSYFQVKNGEGEGLVYTKGNVGSNTTNLNITLTSTSNYSIQTDSGLIALSSALDELNAYYHANHLIDYLQKIDSRFLEQHASSFPITITVNNPAEPNNSYWLEGDGVYLGQGDNSEYRDFAQFSDVIYHEVAHAVTDSIYESQPASNPRRFTTFDAMHEAFSDYWACTINNDPEIAEGGFWLNHESLRTLDNDYHYRLNYGDELYESSLILSGAMWDLRQALRSKYGDIGLKIADTLFLFAMYGEPVTYLDFLLDILAVDDAKYNSTNEALIVSTFGLKGISEPPATPGYITVSVKNKYISLSWNEVAEATGYKLYYNAAAIRALSFAARYNPGGSSEGDGGGSMDGSDTGGGGNNDGNMSDSNSPGWNNSGGNNSGTNNSLNNYTNKVDVGDVTTYQLTNLQNNTEYRMVLTSYNEYGVESSPSQQIYATPVDPNSAINYILVPVKQPAEKSKLSCFISTIGSWIDRL